jgi:hypothetical protein
VRFREGRHGDILTHGLARAEVDEPIPERTPTAQNAAGVYMAGS